MICEMCGKDYPYLKRVSVDGVLLMVCSDCVKFGEEAGKSTTKETPTPAVISGRLEKRERRMTSRSIYGSEEEVLAIDFGERIKTAREKLNYSQEELARKINEKKSVIQKLEHEDIMPTETLIKKLERALNIKLKEKMESTGAPIAKTSAGTGGLTLGDFIKIEGEK